MLALLLLAFPRNAGAQADPSAPSETERPWAADYGAFAVATDHPLASAAAAHLLADGGNAADAAAAALLALGVVNPASSGLGGGGFALYWEASSGSAHFLDFRERAPGAATKSMFAEPERVPGVEGPLTAPSQWGGLSSGVPGEPAGIEALLNRFGRTSWSRVTAPARRLAREGFPVSEELAAASAPFASQMRRDPVMRRWFEPGAAALRPGQRLRRPALLRVLSALARGGARAFYAGRLARDLVRDVRRAGGVLRLEDLRAYRVVWRQHVEVEALGFRWLTAPPPSAGGFTLAATLQQMQRTRWAWQGGSEVDFLHAMAEALKGPYLDRLRYAADPDVHPVPWRRLLDPERAAWRAARFSPLLATPPWEYDHPLATAPTTGGEMPRDHGTSHLCVVDAEGNVAAVTTTVNLPFGARYTAAGIVMNDEMDDFASAPGRANAFGLPGGEANLPEPGKRPVSSMSPTIVLGPDGPVACAGASGGSRIPVATVQVLLRTLVLGESLERAVAAPRIHHQALPFELRFEERAPLPEAERAELAARGHRLRPIERVAVVQAIHIRRDERGQVHSLAAVSDPRKGGAPAGR